ncbi:MAG: DNA-directed RNA polymerase subunit alpha, partial [Chloroflexi bacterium]|nr:DNA-directed RNA polymerase subunit alpha [Chloroflexota bacterium]
FAEDGSESYVEPAEGSDVPNELYNVPIEDLDLPVRAHNCLKRAGINSVGNVLERLAKGSEEMLEIRNFGQKSLQELVVRLKENQYLPDDFELE